MSPQSGVQSNMKKAIRKRIRTLVIVTISFVLVIAFIIFIWVYTNVELYQHPSLTFTMSLNATYDNTTDTYRVQIRGISSHPPIDFNDVRVNVGIPCGDWDKTKADFLVTDILNDESSNVTFYDIDNNGNLSVGDVFIIDEDIVEPETSFHIVYIPSRKLVGKVDLT